MSSHRLDANKPKSLKCHHFCFKFDLHNYCPTCREAGKGDDPCVTQEGPCKVCSSLTEEQNFKIKIENVTLESLNSTLLKTSLIFSGMLKAVIFSWVLIKNSSQLVNNYTLHLLHNLLVCKVGKLLKTAPKLSSHTRYSTSTKIEQNLGSQLNIQLQKQTGVFQAAIMQTLQSVRDELKAAKQTEGGWIRSPLQIISLVLANKLTCRMSRMTL